jgi:hypothetical protein
MHKITQKNIDYFINNHDIEISNIIYNITTTEKIKINTLTILIKENKSFITYYLLNYINYKYNSLNSNEEIIDEILIFNNIFKDNIMNNLNKFGFTPYGFRKSIIIWKLGKFYSIMN